MIICRVCKQKTNLKPFSAREMMFGTQELFEYVECQSCRSLSIVNVPKDLGRHYPVDQYYSMEIPNVRGRLRAWAYRRWVRHLMGHWNGLGTIFSAMRKPPLYINWLKRANAGLDARILDVGCGSGHLLHDLERGGFTDLTGADPFVATEVNRPGFQIARCNLADLEGPYDLVMSHHSLEHMPDPAESLCHMARLVRPGGMVIVRVPIAGSTLWDRFGPDWLGLDAPRHLFVPSLQGMESLRERAGLERAGRVFDASALSILGSRQYQRDIPLEDVRSVTRGGVPFEPEEMDEADREIIVLNEYSKSDSAAFFFVRP